MRNLPNYKTAGQIIQLGNALAWFRNQKMQSKGLTSSQSEAILYILRHQDEGITAGTLMEQLRLSQSTIAGLLKRLEEKNLIERRTADDDGRKSIIQPTQEGLALEEYLKKIAIQVEHILLQGMSKAEQAEFNRLLDAALVNMDSARTGEVNSHNG